MTFRSLMVHLQVGHSNENILLTARNLGERFSADVIGIAACQPMQLSYGEGYLPGDVMGQIHDQIENEMKAAADEFRKAFHNWPMRQEWRSAISFAR